MQHNSSGQPSGATRASYRLSGESRNRNPISASGDPLVGPAHTHGSFPNGKSRPNGTIGGPQQFDLARSPPGATNKNTKHVPCKFFKQGACQAGQACPFSHSTDATVETAPCKYFAKGNCKFGAKCALAHILPDGRRVNRPTVPVGMTMNGGALSIGGRVNPPTYHQDSALANSLLTQQQYPGDPFLGQHQFSPDGAFYAQDYEGRYMAAIADPGLGSNPSSKYGSPSNEMQLPMSGVEHRLTALDAPLPASFDSNGISHIARYGAVAASVPSKFGMESPPASLPQRSTARPVDSVRALHSTMTPSNLRNSSQLDSSPSANHVDEIFGQRKMHSQQGVQRPRQLSASVPRPGITDDWEDDGFPLEEDFLPPNLHDDVLTPQEKMRRLSRPEQDFGGFKSGAQSSSGLGIPSGNSSKLGSPLGSSPSRFSALFAKQRQESGGSNAGGGVGTGGLGHVGSPLRESHIQQVWDSPFGDGVAARPSPATRPKSGQTAGEQAPPTPSHTPRDPSSNLGVSLISSQLERTHLAPRSPESTDAQPSNSSSRLYPPGHSGMRNFSAPVGSAGGGGGSGGRVDRTISSPRISSNSIAEEREGEGDLVFSMDDDTSKRGSGIFAASRSPVITPLNESRNESTRKAAGEKKNPASTAAPVAAPAPAPVPSTTNGVSAAAAATTTTTRGGLGVENIYGSRD